MNNKKIIGINKIKDYNSINEKLSTLCELSIKKDFTEALLKNHETEFYIPETKKIHFSILDLYKKNHKESVENFKNYKEKLIAEILKNKNQNK